MKARIAQPCDLHGQPIGSPLRVSERGRLDVTIHPMAPASFILSDQPVAPR